jgi:hypothetical protein
MFRHRSFVAALCACLVLALCCPLLAKDKKQEAAAAAPAIVPATGNGNGPADPKAYLLAQFGSSLTYLPNFPAITADFDLDGTEDLVLVITGKNPLGDEAQYNFKTIDPYNAFFGWGKVEDTIQFIASEPDPRFLAIVHDWKAATPKLKFVAINFVFEKLYFAKYVNKKKKTLPCIELEDRTGMTSDIFWDGKKWKWADKSLKIE